MVADPEEPVFERSSDNPSVTFSYKDLREHILGVLEKPKLLAGDVVAALGFYSLVISVLASCFTLRPFGIGALSALVAASIVGGIVLRTIGYVREVPKGFENCNQTAQRLAHLRPLKWEAKLAQSLLAEKFGPLDAVLSALGSGAVYVPSRKVHDASEYLDWIKCRSDNLMLLLGVSQELLVEVLPGAVLSTHSREAEPLRILRATELVSLHFRDIVEFEKEGYSVVPPDGLDVLHAHQKGWSDNFRDALLNVFSQLQQIIDVDPNSDDPLPLVIDYGSFPRLSELASEIERLRQNT